MGKKVNFNAPETRYSFFRQAYKYICEKQNCEVEFDGKLNGGAFSSVGVVKEEKKGEYIVKINDYVKTYNSVLAEKGKQADGYDTVLMADTAGINDYDNRAKEEIRFLLSVRNQRFNEETKYAEPECSVLEEEMREGAENIIRILGYGKIDCGELKKDNDADIPEHKDNTYDVTPFRFYEMPYLDGITRKSYPLKDALALGADIANALCCVHDAELFNVGCHGDIKLDNILYENNGSRYDPYRYILTDFNTIHRDLERTRRTGEIGTPATMPPEMFGSGKNEPRYSYTVDYYSLAATMYCMLNGGRYPEPSGEVRRYSENKIAFSYPGFANNGVGNDGYVDPLAEASKKKVADMLKEEHGFGSSEAEAAVEVYLFIVKQLEYDKKDRAIHPEEGESAVECTRRVKNTYLGFLYELGNACLEDKNYDRAAEYFGRYISRQERELRYILSDEKRKNDSDLIAGYRKDLLDTRCDMCLSLIRSKTLKDSGKIQALRDFCLVDGVVDQDRLYSVFRTLQETEDEEMMRDIFEEFSSLWEGEELPPWIGGFINKVTYTVKYETEEAGRQPKERTYTVYSLQGQECIQETDLLLAEEASVCRAGYKVDEEASDYPRVGEAVSDGSVYTIRFIKENVVDQSQMKTVFYAVTYYKDGKECERTVQRQQIWAGADDKLRVSSDIFAADRYEGYEFDHVEPDVKEGTEVQNGSLLSVYYVRKKVGVEENKEAVAAPVLKDPRIVKDASMASGQKVTWDCVWFGSYPQSEVVCETDFERISELRSGAYDNEYVSVSSVQWRKITGASYDDNGDAVIDGIKYRRLNKNDVFCIVSGDSNNYDWSNDTIRYFKYEPVKWRVLNVNGSDALLLADKALTNQPYDWEYKNVSWETCEMRNWLNGYCGDSVELNFISCAFKSGEQNAIKATTVVNDSYIKYGAWGGKCIEDKIFLLSKNQVFGTDAAASYGFVRDKNTPDEARKCKSSMFAKAMGVYNTIGGSNCCWWWLRSPGNSPYNAASVNYGGGVNDFGNSVNDVDYAVRPALHLDLSSSDIYTYAGTVCSDGSEMNSPKSRVRSRQSGNVTYKENNMKRFIDYGIYLTSKGEKAGYELLSICFDMASANEDGNGYKAFYIEDGAVNQERLHIVFRILQEMNDRKNAGIMKEIFAEFSAAREEELPEWINEYMNVATYTVKYEIEDGQQAKERIYTTYSLQGQECIQETDLLLAEEASVCRDGYKVDEEHSDYPKTGEAVSDRSVYTIRLIKDYSQKKFVHFTVVYKCEGQEAFSVKRKREIWSGDELRYSSDLAELPEEYAGKYSVKHVNMDEASVISDGSSILAECERIYVDTECVIKHVCDGAELAKDIFRSRCWAGDDERTVMLTGKALEPNEYRGYRFEKTEPERLSSGDKVKDGAEIRLTYRKALDDVKTVFYAVSYYKDGRECEDTLNKQKIWAGADDKLMVSSEIFAADRYEGYELDHVEPDVKEGTEVRTGSLLNVYYVKKKVSAEKNKKAEAAPVLRNPRIVKDTSMDSRQTVTWDCIWFGSYPQSEVVCETDFKRIKELKGGKYESQYIAVSSTLWNKITSAAYDENGDAVVDGVKYRRLSRKDATFVRSGTGISNYYEWGNDTVRYFKYEPIKWRVLNVNGNDALLLADRALDDQRYNGSFHGVTWESCTMRSWLNGYDSYSNSDHRGYTKHNFINVAFKPDEIRNIKTTAVVNGKNMALGTRGGNNTSDKVFLLSENEVHNSNTADSYGFVKKSNIYDEARRCKNSTFARAMGSYSDIGGSNCCWWWLRSPGYNDVFAVTVNINGGVSCSGSVVNTDNYAVRPALHLDLSASGIYRYAGAVCSDGSEDNL